MMKMMITKTMMKMNINIEHFLNLYDGKTDLVLTILLTTFTTISVGIIGFIIKELILSLKIHYRRYLIRKSYIDMMKRIKDKSIIFQDTSILYMNNYKNNITEISNNTISIQ